MTSLTAILIFQSMLQLLILPSKAQVTTNYQLRTMLVVVIVLELYNLLVVMELVVVLAKML